MKLVTSKT